MPKMTPKKVYNSLFGDLSRWTILRLNVRHKILKIRKRVRKWMK